MFNGMHDYGMGTGFGWGLGFIILIAVIIITILVIRQGNLLHQSTEKSPMDILKERYAKGEIDKAEFDERKKDL